MYRNFVKRLLDFLLSLTALFVLSPLLLILSVIGAFVMKGDPFFCQPRPGKNEKIFYLYKFRSMTNARDAEGNLLPDANRLTPYGRFLRNTSLDELPSLVNILTGDLAIVGPRPMLVRDMTFMTPEQRQRHSVRQGLTGLAQCNGRNILSWEDRFRYDLQYISDGITFWGDVKILLRTVVCVLRRDGISSNGMATSEDLGDYLLKKGAVDQAEYDAKQEEARMLLKP